MQDCSRILFKAQETLSSGAPSLVHPRGVISQDSQMGSFTVLLLSSLALSNRVYLVRASAQPGWALLTALSCWFSDVLIGTKPRLIRGKWVSGWGGGGAPFWGSWWRVPIQTQLFSSFFRGPFSSCAWKPEQQPWNNYQLGKENPPQMENSLAIGQKTSLVELFLKKKKKVKTNLKTSFRE